VAQPVSRRWADPKSKLPTKRSPQLRAGHARHGCAIVWAEFWKLLSKKTLWKKSWHDGSPPQFRSFVGGTAVPEALVATLTSVAFG
jgi:hypothetical protein